MAKNGSVFFCASAQCGIIGSERAKERSSLRRRMGRVRRGKACIGEIHVFKRLQTRSSTSTLAYQPTRAARSNSGSPSSTAMPKLKPRLQGAERTDRSQSHG